MTLIIRISGTAPRSFLKPLIAAVALSPLGFVACVVESGDAIDTREQEQRSSGWPALIEDDFRLGIRKEVENSRNPGWAGHSIGVDPGRRWYRGKMPVDRQGTPGAPRVSAPPGAPSDQGQDPGTSVIIDPSSQDVFESEIPGGARVRLRRAQEKRGYNQGSPPEFPDVVYEALEELSPKEWSGNVDNRTRKAGTTFETIGRLSNGCTGTLIGGPQPAGTYFVLTAAHCLFTENGIYSDPDFVPARSGSTKPFGVWNGRQATILTYYFNHCLDTTDDWEWDCVARDIAVLRVDRPSGESNPGAMGFGSYSMSSVNDLQSYHRGYASCEVGNPDPSTCNYYLWGDGEMGSLAGGGYKLNGWNRIVKHSSDTNTGHSGGPLYVYSSGQKVYGVHATHETTCFGSTAGSSCPPATRPNYARRIEPEFYDAILDFMDSFG